MKQPDDFIHGFSKKTGDEKRELIGSFFTEKEEIIRCLESFHHHDKETQELIEEFSENVVSNFHLPFSVTPNFLINGRTYAVPMVIEESSVIAAAANSAKFWYSRGGFKTEIIGTQKIGQVHFLWKENPELLKQKFPELKSRLIEDSSHITQNMQKRGGGISDIVLKDLSAEEPGLMQLFCTFETVDSMGANFVNSCLEQFAETFKTWYEMDDDFGSDGLEIIMCILSNLTPDCRVKCWVETEINNLTGVVSNISGEDFAHRFYLGMRVAELDPYRATTHNKGIFNGIDAVVLASGNDFRAVEACGHAYASHTGRYSPLTSLSLENGIFKFTLEVPIALGVVGGLTNLHPLVKISLKLLGNPSASELMSVAAAAGLANNFSAVKSLVTTGIQEGHMKMHLFNIMKQLNVPKEFKPTIVEHFKHDKVSVAAVRKLAEQLHQNSLK